ncbi:MAG: glycosyltransferase family A protein [bacterium]|nr:glycosyltransferase family A protein [bacterium]
MSAQNGNPFITIVLPVRNREATLQRAIESVLAQTYRNFELIVVDDASTDATPRVIDSIDDPRIRTIRLDEPGGAPAARNVGIELGRGEWFAFQDSDDIWYVEKLAKQVQALEGASPKAGVCVCSLRQLVFGKSHRVLHGEGEVESAEVLHRIVNGAGYPTVGLLVKHEALERSGTFDTALPRLQDYELTLRLAMDWNFVFVPDVLLDAIFMSDSVSADADRFVRALEIVFDKHAEVFESDRRGKSHWLFRAGKHLAEAGQIKRSIGYAGRAWRVYPGNLKAPVLIVLAATRTYPLFRRIKG